MKTEGFKEENEPVVLWKQLSKDEESATELDRQLREASNDPKCSLESRQRSHKRPVPSKSGGLTKTQI